MPLDWSSPHAWRTAGRDRAWIDSIAGEPGTFWLGTHQPNWTWDGTMTGPTFVSATRLRKRVTPFPRARVPIAIDSGGFTEVTQRGGWTVPAIDYVALVRRASIELGTVEWAAIQDWMVEDVALRSTGLSIAEHQRRTVVSYLQLVSLAPEIRWLPVLQGQTIADYLACWDLYDLAGVDLAGHQLVGLGSVCRRQATDEIVTIVRELAGRGLRMHGFGVKATGLAAVGNLLRSADSLAWSFQGRRRSQPGRTPLFGEVSINAGTRDSAGRSLANSPEHAEQFRRQMVALISRPGTGLGLVGAREQIGLDLENSA